MTEQEKIALTKLKDENGLLAEDFHKDPRGFVIVKRQGIEKILYNNGLHARFELEAVGIDHAVVKCSIWGEGSKLVVETYGSANPSNTAKNMSYYVEMAEKRALSRGVLKAIRAYEYNVFGEDEISD